LKAQGKKEEGKRALLSLFSIEQGNSALSPTMGKEGRGGGKMLGGDAAQKSSYALIKNRLL